MKLTIRIVAAMLATLWLRWSLTVVRVSFDAGRRVERTCRNLRRRDTAGQPATTRGRGGRGGRAAAPVTTRR
jgi:hypothetical protein